MNRYAFMNAEKYEEIKSQLILGVRASLDKSEYVAKLQPEQEPPGTQIKTHAEALEITQGPGWVQENK
ncbi:MAG: hypothetical protein Unbinned4350contig1002_22 [Prokaryotic dsDNA virus sp.]|nr:MAG: hypothetical protein Unbinned4350contig1002_22 [Prokaryotic dsDNA virus sp.]|tara:strand:+ start:126 stop:329 length:204 start_codon:yes stop_codon:yes gene_type:complete